MKYKLDDIEKKSGYKVPEGYFEELPLKIQQRIQSESTQSKTLKVPSWSLAMAASVVIILTSVFLLFQGKDNAAEELLAEVPEEDLIAYLDQFEMDEYDLASAFPEDTEELEFEDIEMLDEVDLEDESIDEILLEFNIEDELEI